MGNNEKKRKFGTKTCPNQNKPKNKEKQINMLIYNYL